jgi:ribonuclease PH
MDISFGSRETSSTHALFDSASNPSPNAPDGVAFVAHGLTEVSVKAFGPREVQSRRDAIHDRANITVQVAMLPFSGGVAGRRHGRGDK